MGKSQGILITFEGTEGAGKSTLIRALEARLRGGPGITVTREPGGHAVAEAIRKILLEQDMNPWTELFLYEAARAEHVARVVRPALERGDIVLCDRFTDSSLAYQGEARGLPWKTIETLNRVATQGIAPDLTVFLDIDPAAGLSHATVQTRFEAEGVAFQQKVRRGFLRARRLAPKRWKTLPARSGTPEEMADRLATEIEKRFLKAPRVLGKKAKRRARRPS